VRAWQTNPKVKRINGLRDEAFLGCNRFVVVVMANGIFMGKKMVRKFV